MSAAAAVLREVVRRYGVAALADPVALRSALRRLGADLPAGEVAALVAVAGAGAADVLRGSADDVDAVVGAVRSRLDLPDDEVRAACAAFAAALHLVGAARERAPVVPHGRAAPSIAWDETSTGVAPAAPAGRSRRRRWVALGLGAVVVAAAVVVVVRGSPTGPPAAVDPAAPDQVAQRYRALGADLVRGVLRCSALAPGPGETERLSCDFGGLTVELAGYDSPGRLRGHRDAALVAASEAARSASTVEAGAAVVVAETVEGRSTVYWDVESPRPVSATVSAARPLAEVLAFHDERRSTAVRRPELPGPAFASPALWDLAATVVVGGRAECAPTERHAYFSGVVEQVSCTFPNGVVGDFGRFVDGRAVTFYRTSAASAAHVVPGTVRTGSWSDFDDPADSQAQLIEYVLAADGDSRLYYDRRETLCFGVLHHPDLGQDRLKEFFVSQGLEQ